MTAPDDRELAELIFDHLCEEQPEIVADLRDSEIMSRVQLGMERARAHGLDTYGAIVAFVTLMFLVAPNFDEQKNILKALEDASLKPDERMKQIFAKTNESDWDEASEMAHDWEDLE